MLRFEVSEASQPALPAIDLDDARIIIGSGAAAQIRLPATAARESHLRIEAIDRRWLALAELRLDGVARRAGDSGSLGERSVFELGAYRVIVGTAPSGATKSLPQRTESLARELVRSLLGDGGAPTLAIENGPASGGQRPLAPPESVLIIGRGDEATWVILDEDLSRSHAEIRRGWDGARVFDLASKNGTRVDGEPVGPDGAIILDGARLELGKLVLRFRDPAERHLRGELALPPTSPPVRPPPAAAPVTRSPMFWIALAIAGVALGGLGWVLAG